MKFGDHITHSYIVNVLIFLCMSCDAVLIKNKALKRIPMSITNENKVSMIFGALDCHFNNAMHQ